MISFGCFQLFLTPFILIGLFMLAMSIGGTLVAIGGVDMPGRVTSVRDTSASDTSSYKAYFTYHRSDNIYSGSADISEENFRRLAPGSDVTVQALSWAPSLLPSLRESEAHQHGRLAFFWCFSIFWNGLLSVFVWAGFIGPILLRRLIVEGIPAEARITEKKTDSSDDSASYKLCYEFVTEAAPETPMKGETTVTQEQWNSIVEGDVLTVLYNAQKPRWSELYRFSYYVVEPTRK